MQSDAVQLALDLPVATAMGEEDFLIAPSNEAATQWVDRWPDWPIGRLALCGPPGSGKTHLSRLWRSRAGAVDGTALNLDARLAALQKGRHLCLDINGAVDDEEGLFHVINWATERHCSLLITGRTAPARWTLSLPDLRSRLQATATAVLGPPDDALLSAVLVKLFADRQLLLGEDVLNYIMMRTDRSFDAARDLVEKLDQKALAERRNITVPFVRTVLGT